MIPITNTEPPTSRTATIARKELSKPVGQRRAGRHSPARRRGSSPRQGRRRWRSRSAGRDPWPKRTHHDPVEIAHARCGPACPDFGRPIGGHLLQPRCRPAGSTACWASGGSSSRMIFRAASKAASAQAILPKRLQLPRAIRRAPRRASRCRCGCRCPSPPPACSGLM